MRNQDLIRHLGKLSQISPKPSWQEEARGTLMMQIRAQQGETARPDLTRAPFQFLTPLRDIVSFFSAFRTVRLAFVQAMAFLVVLGTVLGGGLASSFADGSLPGDVLYPVKIILEQTRLSLTSGEGNKAKVQSERALERLDEVKEIIKKPASASQSIQVKQAIKNFQKEVKAVENHLEKAKQEIAKPQAIEVVKTVTENVQSIGENLDQAQRTASEEAKSELQKAQETVAEAGAKALEVLILKQEETETAL